jgi:hypothetical protein
MFFCQCILFLILKVKPRQDWREAFDFDSNLMILQIHLSRYRIRKSLGTTGKQMHTGVRVTSRRTWVVIYEYHQDWHEVSNLDHILKIMDACISKCEHYFGGKAGLLLPPLDIKVLREFVILLFVQDISWARINVEIHASIIFKIWSKFETSCHSWWHLTFKARYSFQYFVSLKKCTVPGDRLAYK